MLLENEVTRALRLALALAFGLAFVPHVLPAQLSVWVRSTTDVPLRNARVELWNAASLVAARVADDAGLARFEDADRSSATAVLVRRVGFRPTQEHLVPGLDSVVIRLEALQGALPAVTVAASRHSCPQVDEPAARELWERASARYLTPSLAGRRAVTESRRTQVAEREIGDLRSGASSTGSRMYSREGMEGAREAIGRRGYVGPLRGTHFYDDFGIWRYPPLHAELAGQFADSLFGARHTLRLVSAPGASVVVLRFCTADRDQSGVNGTLRLDGSERFMDARWTFWNPSRDAEEAGGEVLFAPLNETTKGPLFSASGLFWRRLPSGRYLQSWQRYSQWVLLPDSARRGPTTLSSPNR